MHCIHAVYILFIVKNTADSINAPVASLFVKTNLVASGSLKGEQLTGVPGSRKCCSQW